MEKTEANSACQIRLGLLSQNQIRNSRRVNPPGNQSGFCWQAIIIIISSCILGCCCSYGATVVVLPFFIACCCCARTSCRCFRDIAEPGSHFPGQMERTSQAQVCWAMGSNHGCDCKDDSQAMKRLKVPYFPMNMPGFPWTARCPSLANSCGYG